MELSSNHYKYKFGHFKDKFQNIVLPKQPSFCFMESRFKLQFLFSIFKHLQMLNVMEKQQSLLPF